MSDVDSPSQTQVLMFKGENFNVWSLKMKIMFHSKGLWNIVDKGFSEEGEEQAVEDLQMKNVRALFLIQ